MQDVQMLRMSIIDTLNFLSLDSLKVLAKFTAFLYHTHDDILSEDSDSSETIHFEVVQPKNPSTGSPRLTYPEQMIYFEKEMEILDEDS